jgi:hypothetical protein
MINQRTNLPRDADQRPITREFLESWCKQFRYVLVQFWPGLVGLVIDGGIADLGASVLNACCRRENFSPEFFNAEIARWVKLEFPEYPIEILGRGALSRDQEEDLDLMLGF